MRHKTTLGPDNLYAIGGGQCPYCARGCKCGKQVMHEGTCIFCGHGSCEPIESFAHMLEDKQLETLREMGDEARKVLIEGPSYTITAFGNTFDAGETVAA